MPELKRRRWLRWLVVLLLLGGGTAAGVFYWKRPKAADLEFRSATVTRGDVTQSVTANGQLTPVVNVEVGSQVSGIIEKIHADFNSRVTNGQVIAQIDPSTFKASVEQAEAELANARASLELAQVNARRAGELIKSRLIPQSEYDTTAASLHQAEAQVKMREASLKRVQTDLERTTIYAPIDGIVIVRNVEMGQTVAASFNTPKLFQIANDLSQMEIDANVSEADVGGVEEGQRVTFTVDAFPTRQFEGRVKQVRYAPSTNQNVVTYTTVVEVNNADLKLRPGMTANASIITAERKGALRLPNAALRFRPPEGATVLGNTNAPAGSGGASNAAPGAGAGSGPFAGLPTPPWQAENRRPTPEEREKYEASLTPEQREQYRQMRDRMRARFAEGGGMGGGGRGGFGGMGGLGSAPGAGQEGPRTQTVYLLDKEKTATGREKPVLKAVTVKTGITDGSFTEVLEGLTENDVVVTGVVRQESATSAARSPTGTTPFGGPFGGPRRF
jgi:HlyD family secretion protein